MTWLGADVERLHSFGLALERLHHELVPLSSVDPRVARALHLVETDLDHVRRTWHQLSFGRMAAVEFDTWGADGAAWWTERFVASSTAADSILRRVIDNSAEQSFADRIRADVALLHGVSDFEVVADFWTRATDPNTVPVDVAGARIRRLLDAIVIHRADRSIFTTLAGHQAAVEQRDRDIDQLLALVIAPWSLHFTALAREWNWTPQEGLHRLHEMLAIPVGPVRWRPDCPRRSIVRSPIFPKTSSRVGDASTTSQPDQEQRSMRSERPCWVDRPLRSIASTIWSGSCRGVRGCRAWPLAPPRRPSSTDSIIERATNEAWLAERSRSAAPWPPWP